VFTKKCRVVWFRGDLVNVGQQDDWRVLYQAALLELDPAKLAERIEQAYEAIQTRMDFAKHNWDPAEHQALADALANLRVLRREVGMPMSNPHGKEPASSSSNQ
jgi:hypothetical protein